jgi:small-conductance mechanosensitive channel
MTQEEDQLTQEAIKLADHEVELAYTMALRQAHLQPPAETPETRALNEQIRSLESQLAEEAAEIASITKLLEKASAKQADDLHDRLDLLQAQKSLNEEELEDAHQDLIDAGGDNESAIQRKFKEYETLQRSTATAGMESKPANFESPANLVAQGRTWLLLRNNGKRLAQAQEAAAELQDKLARESLALNQRLRGERKAIGPRAAGSNLSLSGSKDQRGAALEAVRAHVGWRTVLADYSKRISDAQQLSNIYGQWTGIVSRQGVAVLHAFLRSLTWLLLTVVILLAADVAIEQHLEKLGFDRRQLTTMRMVLRLSLRALSVMIALILLFGPPTQLSTIVAFAGAGLTVAMKDFIVAFFGWFVLMGRNGIHVGDWVEINGIGGEVVEVGLLKTVLMETGNWNDSGHPTGRKVSFVNSFAMENHYFNFTTKGQWMWDELNVLVPAGSDPYALMAEIQKLLVAETRASTTLAEQEWQKATSDSGVQSFSASPAISIRPTSLGINLVVRYITQASERSDLRTRLYKGIVELMRKPVVLGAGA